jgi:predicted nucleotide-binding protein
MSNGPYLDSSPESSDFIEPMVNLVSSAFLTINTQDLNEITIILQKGKSLFKKASKILDSNESEMKVLEICLLSLQATYYSIKAAYSKFEEKFEIALKEYHLTEQICCQGKILINSLFAENDEELEAALFFNHFIFSFFQFPAEGERLEIEHEIIIEKGGFSDLSVVLMASAEKYRQINDVEIHFGDNDLIIPAYIKMLNLFAEIKEEKALRIRQQIHTLKHLPIKSKKIFLVHGHAERLLKELQEILTIELGLECVILKEECNLGDSVIEKFERYAGDCGYAFAILSTDDIIHKKEEKYFQARPNVLFEMGWFYGRYGRKNVCLLRQKDVVMPSDLGGVICLDFENNISEVLEPLRKELTSLGFIK